METKPNGPLSWEEAIDSKCEQYGFRVPYDGSDNFYDKEAIQHFRNGADWSKEFFTSRVQALEEELAKLKQWKEDYLSLWQPVDEAARKHTGLGESVSKRAFEIIEERTKS
jgi:hypothetical protein